METTMTRWDKDALPHLCDVVARHSDRYDRFGLRVMSVHQDDVPAPAVGDTLAPSFVWDDGEPTDETLDGTSALAIGEWDYDLQAMVVSPDEALWAARQAATYWGQYVVVIAGNHATRGQDEGETIIEDATVIAVYDRGRVGCDSDVWGRHER